VAKVPLEWRREGGVLIAYKPPRRTAYTARYQKNGGWDLFARITYHVDEGYRVRTNDWAATDMAAADEEQAKQMVEAMWALE